MLAVGEKRERRGACESRSLVVSACSQRFLIANALSESPVFATSNARPLGVLIKARPDTLPGARKPLSLGDTGVKWPFPSPRSQRPLPASARGVLGSTS